MNPSARTRLSKNLSYLLRHGAQKEKLPIRPDGFAKVQDILDLPKFKKERYTLDQILDVVASDSKQRYSTQDIEGTLYIKANQGHSLEVSDLHLEPIVDPSLFPIVMHGTYKKAWPLIKSSGLNKMSRNHIHLTTGIFGTAEVISGMRGNSEVLVVIDLVKAMQDKIEFFLSPNKVVLTPGVNGTLDPKYFSHVLLSSTMEPFDPDFTTKWEQP
eukprot:TRINITY_DN1316_c0_g1_i2.p1 TRINITY_DN1316_c0_g1~~TRINITY_DN1316_c0_g1_i2.p1  ORF type:complete len:231 (-),score=56.31 TRINITY_DN1316_c0_g1_i2:52-693(-)